MAKVIEKTQKPAIVLAPNKTLAAQLYGEFKGFFPENAVEYFVSYYDYYQPEAYVQGQTHTSKKKARSMNKLSDETLCDTTREGRCNYCCVCQLHLWYWVSRNLWSNDTELTAGKVYNQRDYC